MKRLALVSLVGANLLVALQVVRHDWGYYETILIFWCEALIIGAYNVLRLLLVGFFGDRPLGETVSRYVEFSPGFRVLATVVGTGFFAFKFGTFALGVGLLVVALPAFSAPEGSGGGRVFAGLQAAGPGVAAAVAALVLSHGVSFVRNFMIGREYRRVTLVELIFLPYLRMGLVAIVLTLGLVAVRFLPGLGSATPFAVVMVLGKLAADWVSHTVEHARIGARGVPVEAPPVQPPAAS